jgi:Protein of unknown function (DUF2840)
MSDMGRGERRTMTEMRSAASSGMGLTAEPTAIHRRALAGPAVSSASSHYTRITLAFIPKRLNVYLRFGRPVASHIADAQNRFAYLPSQATFCRVRWQANEYGTTLWQLTVMQTVAPAERACRVVGLAPGAIVLLQVDRANAVQSVLCLIDAIEAQKIDPASVAATYWQTTHNRLVARREPAPYTRDQHAAYLRRRSLV